MELQAKLQAYYVSHFAGEATPQVSRLTDITSGWECEVYTFDLEWPAPHQPVHETLILRLYPGDDGPTKARKEFYILSQLFQAQYPVPRVYLLEPDSAVVGRSFMIMEKIDGKEMWSVLGRARLDQKKAWITRFAALYSRLHELDWRLFEKLAPTDITSDPYAILDGFLAEASRFLANLSSKGFEPALAWVKARRERVPCDRPVLVHFDYHPGNLLVQADGTLIVIDWTASAILDRRFDLAWTCLLLEIYLGKQLRDFFLSEYERYSGAPVQEFAIFEVIACIRRLASIMLSLSLGAGKLGMRPGAEKIMQKQLGPFRKVYRLFRDRSGLRIPEVEDLIRSLSWKRLFGWWRG